METTTPDTQRSVSIVEYLRESEPPLLPSFPHIHQSTRGGTLVGVKPDFENTSNQRILAKPEYSWKRALAIKWIPATRKMPRRRWLTSYFLLALGCDTPILSAIDETRPRESCYILTEEETAWLDCECTACVAVSKTSEPKYFWSSAEGGPGCELVKNWLRIDHAEFLRMAGCGFASSDIRIVMNQTSSTREQAVAALVRSDADLVRAIVSLVK